VGCHILILGFELQKMVLQCEHGFVIGLATLISFALFGANVNRVGIVVVDIIQPNEFVGLIAGAIFLIGF
jgi:hypothetical protein